MEQKDFKNMSQEDLVKEIKTLQNQVIHTDFASMPLKFAQTVSRNIWDTTKSSKTSTVSFSNYSKSDIINWLLSPENNEVNLRNASIYYYNTSTQYKRLITYMSQLLTWAYTLSPTKLDLSKIDSEDIKKQYTKTLSTVETWNLKHEFSKAATIALREDVFYGVEQSNKDSFQIIPMNPDYCSITNLIDGCYAFSIDMSKIKESELNTYPEIITKLYKNYASGGDKWQLVPEELCWCLKFNETTDYPIPPFVSTLSDLCDINDYKDLQLAKTEIQNYKALSLKVPIDKDGVPLIEWNLVQMYYAQIADILPDYVGLIASPMEVTDFNFEKSGSLSELDTVIQAEEQFWNSTGTSALLFGNSKNKTAGALGLSINADEEVMFAFMEQCQRLVNRRLKKLSGKIKFKINFLPITIYNQKNTVDMYSKVLTYGYPVKRAACAALGLTPDDVNSQAYFENEVLDLKTQFVPVQTSHTQSNNVVGRPTETGDAGEVTAEAGSNDDR